MLHNFLRWFSLTKPHVSETDGVRLKAHLIGVNKTQCRKGPSSRCDIQVKFIRYLSSALTDPGGHAWRTPPPMGPNSFVFAYIFIEKCPHGRSTPHYGKSWIRHWTYTRVLNAINRRFSKWKVYVSLCCFSHKLLPLSIINE